jgi:NADP-dependent 3-hydroxy acid dehydrogenase YdfG
MGAQVAILAGAGGALGRATTATLAASGLTVVAVDRNERALRELQRRHGAGERSGAAGVWRLRRLAWRA